MAMLVGAHLLKRPMLRFHARSLIATVNGKEVQAQLSYIEAASFGLNKAFRGMDLRNMLKAVSSGVDYYLSLFTHAPHIIQLLLPSSQREEINRILAHVQNSGADHLFVEGIITGLKALAERQDNGGYTWSQASRDSINQLALSFQEKLQCRDQKSLTDKEPSHLFLIELFLKCLSLVVKLEVQHDGAAKQIWSSFFAHSGKALPEQVVKLCAVLLKSFAYVLIQSELRAPQIIDRLLGVIERAHPSIALEITQATQDDWQQVHAADSAQDLRLTLAQTVALNRLMSPASDQVYSAKARFHSMLTLPVGSGELEVVKKSLRDESTVDFSYILARLEGKTPQDNLKLDVDYLSILAPLAERIFQDLQDTLNAALENYTASYVVLEGFVCAEVKDTLSQVRLQGLQQQSQACLTILRSILTNEASLPRDEGLVRVDQISAFQANLIALMPSIWPIILKRQLIVLQNQLAQLHALKPDHARLVNILRSQIQGVADLGVSSIDQHPSQLEVFFGVCADHLNETLTSLMRLNVTESAALEKAVQGYGVELSATVKQAQQEQLKVWFSGGTARTLSLTKITHDSPSNYVELDAALTSLLNANPDYRRDYRRALNDKLSQLSAQQHSQAWREAQTFLQQGVVDFNDYLAVRFRRCSRAALLRREDIEQSLEGSTVVANLLEQNRSTTALLKHTTEKNKKNRWQKQQYDWAKTHSHDQQQRQEVLASRKRANQTWWAKLSKGTVCLTVIGLALAIFLTVMESCAASFAGAWLAVGISVLALPTILVARQYFNLYKWDAEYRGVFTLLALMISVFAFVEMAELGWFTMQISELSFVSSLPLGLSVLLSAFLLGSIVFSRQDAALVSVSLPNTANPSWVVSSGSLELVHLNQPKNDALRVADPSGFPSRV